MTKDWSNRLIDTILGNKILKTLFLATVAVVLLYSIIRHIYLDINGHTSKLLWGLHESNYKPTILRDTVYKVKYKDTCLGKSKVNYNKIRDVGVLNQ